MGPNPPEAAGEVYRRNPSTLSNRYRPVKNPRKIWSLSVCIHSPPIFHVWLPRRMEMLFLICVRQISSSTFGWRKNGFPKRKLGENPMPVSAKRFDSLDVRGRLSREYVK